MTAKNIRREQSILVVDDTPENLEFLTGMLKERGYIVRPVPSGEMALMTARVNPPDLVLLDINMPEMDGYEVCRRFKEDEGLKDIPIIFLTAMTETMEKIKAFGAGGVDYITKPFELLEVEARIKTHLTIREQKRQLKESAEAKYYSIFDNAIEGIFQVTPGGEIITANYAFVNMHGYGSAREINLRENYFVDPGTYKKLKSILQKKKVVERFETEVYHKDGSKIWLSVNVRAVLNENDEIMFYEGMVGNITKEKEWEERLRQSEEELRALVETMNDIILVVDKNGTFSRINANKPVQHYMTKNNFIGEPLGETYDKATAALFLKSVQESLGLNKTVNIEYSLEEEDSERWFAAAISPMPKELALVVARDITELKMTESKLEAKSVRLEEINTTLNILLEKMKESNKNIEETMHSNIRTFVVPYIENMKKLRLTEMQKTYLDLIESNLLKLSSPLIHSMRQFNLTPMEIDVANLIKEGKNTKEIASLLHTTKVAVDIHRYNIRKKLGLNNQKINLRSYILSVT